MIANSCFVFKLKSQSFINLKICFAKCLQKLQTQTMNYVLRNENTNNNTYVSGVNRMLFHGTPYATLLTAFDQLQSS